MPTNHHFTRSACLLLVGLLIGCADTTSSGAAGAVFVLRSIGADTIPATIVLDGHSYTILADTLSFGARSVDGHGTLRRAFAAAFQPRTPSLVRTEHDFIWRESAVSVLFGCPHGRYCLTIYSYETGTLSGRTLVFPTHARFIVNRRYERLR